MRGSKRAIRVLIADDHPTTRAGIRAVLAGLDDIKVVGEAQDGSEAMRLVEETNPDILLLDLVTPGPPPSDVERWVRSHHPETTTLVLTAHDRDCFLARMVEAGVSGFLSKEDCPSRLAEAVRRAASGEILITIDQLRRVDSWHGDVAQRLGSLTPRERRVLELLVEGVCTRKIAEALVIEETTVNRHVGNILGKLGAASRAEAVAWAWKHRVFERMPGAG